MAAIVWKDEYSVGIKMVDDQHKELFARINKLFDEIQKGNKNEVLQVLNFLNDYTVYHFNAEQNLMAQAKYPDLEEHIKKHEWFKGQIKAFHDEIDNKGVGVTVTVKLNKVLVDWLINHVTKTDTQYAPYVKQAGLA
ncbi:bacteriohemerythrin [Coprothermobacter platensis]|uniref:bacteriohemerythrin n=1 Tax=Coprothermobacter platensis TaxID=108819 RepID=UPI00036EB308|nr:bacteriohemerythrin [Coprothermobacter platensis]